MIGIVLSLLLAVVTLWHTGLYKPTEVIDPWYIGSLIAFSLLGLCLGYLLDTEKVPLIWRLKNEIVELRARISEVLENKKIEPGERDRVKDHLRRIHNAATKRGYWEGLVALLFAPYYVVYVLFTEKQLIDCAFSFSIVRYLEEADDEKSRELVEDALQSLRMCRGLLSMGRVVGYATLLTALVGIALQCDIVNLAGLLRYFFISIGMVLAIFLFRRLS